MRPTLHAQFARGRFARAGLIAVAAATTFVSVGCTSSEMSSDAPAGRGQLTAGPATTMPAGAQVSSNRPAAPAAAANGNRVRAALFATPAAPREGEMIRGSLAYPTGDPKTSAIVLEKAVPAEVVSGKPYVYELTVRNVSSTRLENVEIVETLPAGLQLAEKVEGAMLAVRDDRARFRVGGLAAGESRSLRVSATATQGGAVTSGASVTFDSSLVMGTNVVTPALAMTQSLPADTLVCDDVPLKLSLTNGGTGTARNVRLEDRLPEGVTTADGKPTIYLSLGDLVAGETKHVELPLKLSRAGTFTTTAFATADDGLKAEATATVNAHQAVLELEKAGPKQSYVGVNYTYDVKLTNKGDADATNVTIVNALPAGLTAVEASDGGVIGGGKVTWTLPRLAQATAKQLKLTVKGTDPGTAHNTVTANADCAATASVSADTQLVGVSAIVLEVLDQNEPIIVGSETTYTLVVTNEGSAAATNVRLSGELESPMEYVASTGTTPALAQGRTVSFAPLATLAPKARVSYTVTVRAKEPGDVRFKTTLTSDQLGRPVEDLESSTFYK